MSWGTHPDTMTMANAQNQAIAETGENNTLAYRKAYRDAYAKIAGSEPGAEAYLKRLDANILKMEQASETGLDPM
jgi:hypothetical protein